MGDIKLELAKEGYFPKELLKGVLKLKNDKAFDLEELILEIMGIEETKIQAPSGRSLFTYSSKNDILKENLALEGPDHLEDNEIGPGEHEFYFSFRIPIYALPSYSGTHATVSYHLNARVENPDINNLSCVKPFYISRRKNLPHMYEDPVHFNSPKYFDPKDLNPGLYVEIANSGYIAGEDIWGFITLKNMATLKVRKIVLELAGYEYAYAQNLHRSIPLHRKKMNISTANIKEGIPIQFIFPTSKGIPASYEGMYSNVRWTFEVRLDISSIFQVRAKHDIEILR
jgi:hypothetical protein